jgi:hypothetical protein
MGADGSGDQQNESLLQIYFKKEDKTGFSLYSNKFNEGHNSTINDVAWAPLMGRSFHMISTCSRDTIIVWKVVVRDIFNDQQPFFKEPLIEKLFK